MISSGKKPRSIPCFGCRGQSGTFRMIWVHSISRNSDKTASCFLSEIVNSELTKDAFFLFDGFTSLFSSWTQKPLKDCQDSSIFRPQLTVVLTAPFWINRYLENKGFLWFLKSLFRQKNNLNEPNDSTTQDAGGV